MEYYNFLVQIQRRTSFSRSLHFTASFSDAVRETHKPQPVG